MGNLRNITCVAFVGLLAAGCATHQTAKLDSAYALKSASTAAASSNAATTGIASAANGDKWTAANLFEQAQAGYDSPQNRFNLAAAYQSTGRSKEAAVLYRSVVVDGQFTKASTNRMAAHQRGPSERVNLAQEAQRRLAIMDARAHPTITGSISSGAFAAGDVAVPVSAIVGGAPTSGRISDARALQLDEAAEAAIGG